MGFNSAAPATSSLATATATAPCASAKIPARSGAAAAGCCGAALETPPAVANLCNMTARPHAYDALTLPGLLAYPLTNSVATLAEPVMQARVVRAAARGSAVYACGYAAVPSATGETENTWEMEGFACATRLGSASASASVGATPTSTCVLRATDVLGVTRRLTTPRAILPIPCSATAAVIVVGNGLAYWPTYINEEPAPPLRGPAIAAIPVCVDGGSGSGSGYGPGCCSAPTCVTLPLPSLCVLTDLGEDAEFFDAIWHAEQPGTWLVVAGRLGTAAMLWTVDATTCAVLASVTLTPEEVTAHALCAVSVAHVCGMYVAGVHVTESSEDPDAEAAPTQSLLWPVADGTFTTLAPWSATSYNVLETVNKPRLRPAANSLTNLVLRVFGVANTSAVLAATLVRFDQSYGAPLPAHGAAVYSFTADTAPDTAFGMDGVIVWFDAELGTTRPTDAVLLMQDGGSASSMCQPRVMVVGNALETEALVDPGYANARAPAVQVPGFPYLDVYLGNPTDIHVAVPTPNPVPFAVVVGGTAATVIVRGLGAGTGCCSPPYRWIGAVAQTGAGAVALLGDVCWHPGCVSQSASLLGVLLALSCPPRILNAQVVGVPIVNNNCDGRVEVDARCAPTTLMVRGGIVLGCDAMPLPGTLRFNVDTNAVEVCSVDGVTWRALAYASAP
jgi:hypothetical protein